MLPTILEPEPQAQAQSKSDQKPKRDAGQIYVSCFSRKVSVYKPPYFPPEREAAVGISVITLDLRSGDVADCGPHFIKPASRDEMKKFIERNRPWEKYDLKPIRWDEMDDPKQNKGKPWELSQKWHAATFMLSALTTFAETPLEPRKPGEPMNPNPSPWFNDAWKEVRSWRDMSWKKYWFRCPGKVFSWAAQFFMIPRDTSKPHVNAFLVDAEPFHDDALSTGEVAVATGLVAVRRCRQTYNGHRYIPITIFSTSDRQFRIVQVWHDREEPRSLHFRRSPIMEFWEGAKGNWEDWITILCWMMGDPVLEGGGSQIGETKKDG